MPDRLVSSPGRGAAIDWLLVAVIALLATAMLANAHSVIDTARDVYNAWNIASGEQFPLSGPLLAGVVSTGPAWYYLLSLPLLFSDSWLLTALWVGLLASLKYPLAYYCGCRQGSRAQGLFWVGLLSLPGWSSVNYLVFGHASLVETAVLAVLLLAWKWWQLPGPAKVLLPFTALALVLSLSLHAHPTCLGLVVALMPMVLLRLWQRRLPISALLAGALAALLPFLPYLLSQASQGWPDAAGAGGFIGGQSPWDNLSGLPELVRGTWSDGPRMVLERLLGLSPALALAASLVLNVLLLAGGLLACWQARSDSACRLLVWFSLVCLLVVALIRPVTPFYMTLVLLAPVSGLAARGLALSLAGQPVAARRLAPAFLVLCLGLLLVTGHKLGQIADSGQFRVAGTLVANVRSHDLASSRDTIFVPANTRNALGQWLCSQESPWTMHGWGSLALFASYGLEARMPCPGIGLHLGGQGPGVHGVGVPRYLEAVLQPAQAPLFSNRALLVYPASQVLWPPATLPLPEGDVYPPRQFHPPGSEWTPVQFTTGAEETILVTNLYFRWMPLEVRASLNGRPVAPLLSTDTGTFYRCADCQPGQRLEWQVELHTSKPEYAGIVTLESTYER